MKEIVCVRDREIEGERGNVYKVLILMRRREKLKSSSSERERKKKQKKVLFK